MHEYWHVILEALKHTAKILPFLFIVYYLIELFEYVASLFVVCMLFRKSDARQVALPLQDV